jgi:hypothetical protein
MRHLFEAAQLLYRKRDIPTIVLVLMMLFATAANQVCCQPVTITFEGTFGKVDSCKNPANFIEVHPAFLPKPPQKHNNSQLSKKTAVSFSPASFDFYFYLLCGLLLFLGFTLRAFPKYYTDLYRVFSQSGFRQKSIRDQLLQNKVASLGLNTIFFLSGGIYIYLIATYNGLMPKGIWYFHIFICVSFLMVIYGVKYIALVIGGWIFSAKELVTSYNFLVFFVNKITGLVLLPVIVVLWLGNQVLHPFFAVASLILVSLLFLYRYFLILPMVRNRSGVSSLHFFIYLCTFEILPIMVLVKYLINFLINSN